MPTGNTTWWRDAVCYQVYVRSFADSDGDGIGDLNGVTSRIGYLELLGVDALWLTPFYRSPMVDNGYDVADPRDVDPLFGDLKGFDRLLTEAHAHGIRVIVDLVPNHTSDQHPWFTEALAAPPGSSARERYIFADGRADDQPPNNWVSPFGGSTWTRVPDGQWYLHLFAPEQPDLNWENPEIGADLEHTLRFWLDRGVDGFRIDVAHGMAKQPGLPDMDERTAAAEASGNASLTPDSEADPRWDNEAVHDIHRSIRKVVDEYPGAMTIGEVCVRDRERFGRYLRQDELHLGFNFRLAEASFDAAEIRTAIERSLDAVRESQAPPSWALSNHDISREVTRYGGGELGLARARAMLLVELALPGTVYLYNGSELGLPDVELPDCALRDPTWERSGHTRRGRDACRVPLPWESEQPNYGFSTGERTWLPMPAGWAEYTAEAQLENPESMLSLCRHAIQLRRTESAFSGDELEWYGAPEGCLAFRRKGGGLTCALNTSQETVARPPGDILLASSDSVGEQLPPNTAVWLINEQ